MHRIEYVRDSESQHRAVCTCGSRSAFTLNRADAEDWAHQHDRLVQQAMAHLRNRSPSVTDQYNYFTTKANDPEERPEHRVLWQQLADELRGRVPIPAHDEALPFEVKYTPRYKRSKDRP